MTVGHSTRTLGELVTLLESNGVRHLIDVRSSPTSRRWPHFNQKPLADALHAKGIRYSHLPELGGRRNRGPTGNANAGWSEPGFRNYADYMQTAEFERGIALLVHAAAWECVAIMCSEAVWWRCHRRLIADALLVRGIQVQHILSERSVQLARLTPFAVYFHHLPRPAARSYVCFVDPGWRNAESPARVALGLDWALISRQTPPPEVALTWPKKALAPLRTSVQSVPGAESILDIEDDKRIR